MTFFLKLLPKNLIYKMINFSKKLSYTKKNIFSIKKRIFGYMIKHVM